LTYLFRTVTERSTSPSVEMAGESFEAHRTSDGGIVIHLGADDAERYSVNATGDGEGSDGGQAGKGSPRRKVQSKQKFQCPKCDKVWNWPWELRRHVVSHYKEVLCSMMIMTNIEWVFLNTLSIVSLL
jgi:hypothetical protein